MKRICPKAISKSRHKVLGSVPPDWVTGTACGYDEKTQTPNSTHRVHSRIPNETELISGSWSSDAGSPGEQQLRRREHQHRARGLRVVRGPRRVLGRRAGAVWAQQGGDRHLIMWGIYNNIYCQVDYLHGSWWPKLSDLMDFGIPCYRHVYNDLIWMNELFNSISDCNVWSVLLCLMVALKKWLNLLCIAWMDSWHIS